MDDAPGYPYHVGATRQSYAVGTTPTAHPEGGIMSERVDNFIDGLRDRLNTAEDRLESVKARVGSAKAAGKEKIQEGLEEARAKIEAGRQELTEATDKMKALLEEKKAETQATIDDWKARREIEKLEKRAERGEDYAASALAAAVGAIEHADVAVLEAVAARMEAEDAAAGEGGEASVSG
jgi:DNA anti-recombination protein RmuC